MRLLEDHALLITNNGKEMRIQTIRTCICLYAFCAMIVGCNRKNYQAHEYNPPLSTPVPVPGGEYSNPAAATPELVAPLYQDRKIPDDGKAAQNNLPGYYFNCPPPGTTPPSATVVEKGSALSAIDCPPGDPNASNTRTGLPGTPGTI